MRRFSVTRRLGRRHRAYRLGHWTPVLAAGPGFAVVDYIFGVGDPIPQRDVARTILESLLAGIAMAGMIAGAVR